MKTKLKSILAAALCAVGLAAFAAEPDAVQLWKDGPYFATCNVGANAPQDSGIHTNFNGAAQAVTDALGTEWRVPSEEELEMLAGANDGDKVCSNVWTTCNGVAGRRFFGTTSGYEDKSIFLPAAGYDYGDSPQNVGKTGYYRSSTEDEDNIELAWIIRFTKNEFTVRTDDRSGGWSVRAVRDTPPPPKPEISAVSAEGFLDLTVGDRVAAEPEELLVVDPAWGEASEATVDFAFGGSTVETRTYNCASNDLWETTALMSGRYTLALTAGTDNETAAFWKLGAGWEVLDNSQYNEGIEFQAGTTYLVLTAATVPVDKTLTVTDRAKFEYGTGAGFKGGKLEAPRRYRKVDVGDGLYQIVEKIKGCADNPWEVGDGVEAYTNGNELVIVGKGTITDLSEIEKKVKDGIAAITIGAGVTDAKAGVFYGFGSDDETVAVTLPDNWQGELPDEKGNWCGAKGAELTAYPMAVKNVKPQQRYPWNGLVDVTYDVSGTGSVKVVVSVTTNGVKAVAIPTVTGDVTVDLGDGKELKDVLKLTWDAKADFGDEALHEKIKVKLTITPAEPK